MLKTLMWYNMKMNEYMYLEKINFATAVSFTVAESIYKIKENRFTQPGNVKKWKMVVSDGLQHFNHDLGKIVQEKGYCFTETPFAWCHIDSRTLIGNRYSGCDGRIYLNIGPGKINLPMDLEVGDAMITTTKENTFYSRPESIVIYRDLVKND